MFNAMPTISYAGSLVSNNNPGTETSNTSIAVSKGWSVEELSIGDGTGCPTGSINIQKEELYISYFSQEIFVKNTNLEGRVDVMVFSINGKMIMHTQTETIDTGSVNIRTGSLPFGIYLIKLVGKNNEVNGKFIVSN